VCTAGIAWTSRVNFDCRHRDNFSLWLVRKHAADDIRSVIAGDILHVLPRLTQCTHSLYALSTALVHSSHSTAVCALCVCGRVWYRHVLPASHGHAMLAALDASGDARVRGFPSSAHFVVGALVRSGGTAARGRTDATDCAVEASWPSLPAAVCASLLHGVDSHCHAVPVSFIREADRGRESVGAPLPAGSTLPAEASLRSLSPNVTRYGNDPSRGGRPCFGIARACTRLLAEDERCARQYGLRSVSVSFRMDRVPLQP
jgi:hypothetical protein